MVLIEFWAFECVNCLRSVPWMHSVQERYKDLVIVGVHTPELPQERAIDNVRAAVEKLGITYPVMLDADYSYWRAMDNKYWPAFYLIGTDGRITAQAIGEMHVGQSRAKEFEQEIDKALMRRNGACLRRRTRIVQSHIARSFCPASMRTADATADARGPDAHSRGHDFVSNVRINSSVMKRLRAPYTCLSPVRLCCVM